MDALGVWTTKLESNSLPQTHHDVVFFCFCGFVVHRNPPAEHVCVEYVHMRSALHLFMYVCRLSQVVQRMLMYWMVRCERVENKLQELSGAKI